MWHYTIGHKLDPFRRVRLDRSQVGMFVCKDEWSSYMNRDLITELLLIMRHGVLIFDKYQTPQDSKPAHLVVIPP